MIDPSVSMSAAIAAAAGVGPTANKGSRAARMANKPGSTTVSVTPVNAQGKDDAATNGTADAAPQRTFRPSPLSIAYEKKTADIDQRINLLRQKMDNLRVGLNPNAGLAGGNVSDANRAARDQVFEQLRSTREKLRTLDEERRKFSTEFFNVIEQLKKKSADAKEAKDKLPLSNIADIDRRIKELDVQIESGSLKLSEERVLLQEISKLRRARKAVEAIDSTGTDSNSLRIRADNAKARMGEKEAAIEVVRAELATLTEKLNELNGIRGQEQAKKMDHRKEIDKVKAEMDAEYEKRRAAYAEYKQAKNALQANALKAQARRAEQQRRMDIESQIDDLEKALSRTDPSTAVDKKWNECTNLAIFFSQYVPAEEGATTVGYAAPAATTAAATTAPAAAPLAAKATRKPDAPQEEWTALPRKSEREEFGGYGKLATSKKGNSKAAAPASVNHDLARLPIHIIAALSDISLALPTDLPSVKKLLAALDARKNELRDKREESVAAAEEKQAQVLAKIAELRAKLDAPVPKVSLSALRKENAAAAAAADAEGEEQEAEEAAAEASEEKAEN